MKHYTIKLTEDQIARVLSALAQVAEDYDLSGQRQAGYSTARLARVIERQLPYAVVVQA